MVKSLYTGVSGLKTHQQRMDVIGNNIANVNTIGNKADVVTFKDVYYQTKRSPSAATSTLGGVNPRQVGYGVQMNTTMANMTQSGYTQSDNKWDMAINGNGFFQVMDGAGNIFYTRAGAFSVDNAGYVVNADGYHVLGTMGDPSNQGASSEILRIVVPATNAHVSSATKKIAGTNVTISVTAPSDYTDMTVSFVESNYPFATFANNILTIYFNPNTQYESEQDFEDAINLALEAGGVTLPDDVEIAFDFETIPSEPQAVAGYNSVSGLEFNTTNASATFCHKTSNGKWAYMAFSVPDNTNVDNVTITHAAGDAPPTVEYTPGTGGAAGTWAITISDSTTQKDIAEVLKNYIADWDVDANDGVEIPRLSIDTFVVPTVPDMTRAEVLAEWFGGGAGATNGAPGEDVTTLALKGVKDKSIASGLFDFNVMEAGAFSNDYKIVFAYVQGYDKTKAVWDENTLTVSICANSTIADVNAAIAEAANGNDKRMIKFNDISGLDYGPGYDGNHAVLDDNGNVVTAPAAKAEVWNPGIREAFFGGNPQVAPKYGDDSFFTKVAKSLSTFALEDGRTGEVQSKKDFTDIQIQQDGTIIGLHPVHGFITLGRIDLATFDNENGLAKVGGTNFQATVASGPAYLGVPGTGGTGVVISGALEMSNVDLADEFTNMITTQRGYQANSRVITVSDTMIEELLSLKR